MVAADGQLDRFLETASRAQARLFVASCVERVAGGFFLVVADDDSRADDVKAYMAALDELWLEKELTGEESASWREKLSRFDEIHVDEEPSGLDRYPHDAVVAMLYAYSYLTSDDSSNILYCANRVLNSADFLENRAGADSGFYVEEENARAEVINLVSSGDVDRASLRDRSRGISRRRVEALVRIFR